jgi:hypothetical protein
MISGFAPDSGSQLRIMASLANYGYDCVFTIDVQRIDIVVCLRSVLTYIYYVLNLVLSSSRLIYMNF